MFFFKKKKVARKSTKAVLKTKQISSPDRDRANMLKMIRIMRRKISPEVLAKAETAAFSQIGEMQPTLSDNDASKLFKLAMNNNGARRQEILELVERRVNKQLH